MFQSDPVGQSSFTTGTSWTGGAAPTAGNNYFTGAFILRTPNDSASNFTFAGDALTIDASGALRYVGLANSTPVITVTNLIMDGGLIVNGANELASGTSTLTLSGSMTLKSNSGLNLGSADSMQHNVVLNSTLTGTGGFYIGTSTVSGSINPVALVTINGNNSGFSGGFFLSRNYTDKLGATVTLNGTNATYPQIMSSATIRLGHVNALGTGQLAIDAGTVDLNGLSPTIGSLAGAGGAVVNNGGGAVTFTVGNDNTNSTYSGSIQDRTSGAGTLALMKAGTGVLTLSGSNSYTGGTQINAGVLAFGHTSGLGTGTVTIGSGTLRAAVSGTLANPIAVNAARIDTNGNSVRLSGVISGSNGLTKVATTGTLTLAGDNTFTGDVVVDGTSSPSVLVATRSTSLGMGTKTVTVTGYGRTLALDGSGGNITLGSNISYSFSDETQPALWNLSGSNTVSGSIGMTTGGGGTLIQGDAGSLTLAGNIGVTSASSRNLLLSGSAGGTVSGTVGNGNGTTVIIKQGNGTWTLSGSNTYTGGTQINAGVLAITNTSALGTGTVTISSGTLRAAFSGTLANPFAANAARVDTNGNAVTLSGVISGSNGFTKVATTGTLTLAGDNSFTGDVSFDGITSTTASVLVVTRSTSLGTGAKNVTVTGYGKTLMLDGSAGDITLASTISLTLSNNSQAVVNRAGNNTISGPITMAAGGADTAIESNAGSLTLAGNIGVASGANLRTLILTGSAGGTVSANVTNGSGTAALRKTGAGTWTLSGSNTYSGTTTVSAGVLTFGKQAALYGGTTASWTKSNITIDSGATLGVRVGDAASGSFDSAAVDTLLGAGGLGASDASSGLKSGALFAFDTTNATAGSFTYASTIANPNGGTNVLGIVKLGSGTLTLSGSNTYTGGATVSIGRLTLGHANALGTGTATVAGGELNIAAFTPSVAGFRITSGTLLGTGTLTSSSTYDVQAGSVAANLGGSVGLTKSTAGTVTLSGNNTYTGRTTISGGTLSVGSGGTSGSVAGNITNNATLVFNRSDNLTYSGTISGSGSLQKLGPSTLTLSGSALTAGTLLVGYNDTASGTNTLTVAAASAVSIGTGASDQLGVGIWDVDMPSAVTSVLDLRNATTLSINVGTLRVGVANAGSTASAKNALLQLPGASTITAATSFVIGDSGAPLGLSSESVTTTGLGTTTVRTPTMTIGASKATGSFTLGVGTLDLAGTGGGRTALSVGDFSNSSAGTGSTFTGTADFSAGTLIASLSSLVVGRMNQANSGSEAATLTLGTSAANRLDISGAAATNGAVVVIGRNLNVGTGVASGTVTIGKLDSASQIVAEDNGTAILLGSRTSSGPAAGTLNLNGGTLTITTTGNGITGGSGTSTVNFNGTTLRAGAASANWITGLTTANVQAGGALFDTNAFDVTIAQAFSGTGGLTKLGAGALTLSGSNTYSGNATVNAGRLTLGHASALGTGSATVGGGELNIGSYAPTISGFTITSGSLTGTGKLTAPTYGLGGGTVTANLGSGTVTVTANSTLSGTSDATTLSLNAGTLTLGSGGGRFTSSSIAVSGSAGASLMLGGNESFGSLSGAANVALGASTLSVGGLGTSTTYSGNLSGSGILAKLGSGTFTLSGNNTHSGGTQIANGTLQLGSSTALPTSSAVTLGTGSTAGVLAFNGNTATLGSITFNGSGSQLSGTSGGKLNLLASGTNNATITVTSGSHILHPDTSLQSNTVIDVNSGAIFTLHGVVDGSKSLTKLGSGTLAINGNNSYSGGSYLNGGYVSALNTGALGSGTVTIDGNTILNLNNTVLSNMVVFGSGSGAIINSGSFVNVTGTYSITSGTGTSITTNYSVQSGGDISFVNNLASTVEVQNGAVGTFTADVLGGGGVTVNAGGRGVFSGSVTGPITTSGSATFSGGVLGNVTIGGGTATFAGPTDAASAVNVNSGVAVFTGTIGGIAHATAAAATVEIRGRVLSSADVNAEAGGVVKLMGSQAFDGTTIDNDGSVIVDRTANLTLAAVISGSGSLAKSDALTLTLTGNNTFSGLTTISGGTLSIGNGGASGALAGNVVNNAALIFNRSDTSIYAGNISGSGGLEKRGAGKLSLTGSHSFLGSTAVNAGTLAVNGQLGGNVSVASGAFLAGSGSIGGVLSGAGIVSPGNSPGILTASQFDATGGLGAAFEFTVLAPVYTSSTASLNDVLRLTNVTPFNGSLTASNMINVYFDVDSIAYGQVFEGGFFTDLSAGDLLTAVQHASFNYWIKDNAGATVFNNVHYSTLTSVPGITGVNVTTTSRTADFGSGSVNGSVTQFVIVPEPGAASVAGIGIAIVGWALRKRRPRRPDSTAGGKHSRGSRHS